MNQPHEAIRPRHRRHRHGLVGGGETAATRAEQSTRVLIRVPMVAVDAKAGELVVGNSAGLVAGNSALSNTAGRASAVPPPPVTTTFKQQGSGAVVAAVTPKPLAEDAGVAARIQSVTKSEPRAVSPAKLEQSKSEQTKAEQIKLEPVKLEPAAKTHVRIHAAHAGTSGPHSGASARMEQTGNWVAGLLQRRSMLAVAFILVAAVAVGLMLHHRTPRADRTGSDADATDAPRSPWKAETSHPAEASNSPALQNGVNGSPYRYSAASSQGGGVGSTEQQQIARAIPDASPSAATNVATQGSRYEMQNQTQNQQQGNPAAQPRWNSPADANAPAGGNTSPASSVPAGANMPARIQSPPAAGLPNTAVEGPSLGPQTMARQALPAANGGSAPGAHGRITGVTMFEGNINNPAQFSR